MAVDKDGDRCLKRLKNKALTVVLVEGDVPRGPGHHDDGQHDEAEHEQEDDQVEHDQEAQEGEVGQDPSAEHPCQRSV